MSTLRESFWTTATTSSRVRGIRLGSHFVSDLRYRAKSAASRVEVLAECTTADMAT
jgi:hypothetical protein